MALSSQVSACISVRISVIPPYILDTVCRFGSRLDSAKSVSPVSIIYHWCKRQNMTTLLCCSKCRVSLGTVPSKIIMNENLSELDIMPILQGALRMRTTSVYLRIRIFLA